MGSRERMRIVGCEWAESGVRVGFGQLGDGGVGRRGAWLSGNRNGGGFPGRGEAREVGVLPI